MQSSSDAPVHTTLRLARNWPGCSYPLRFVGWYRHQRDQANESLGIVLCVWVIVAIVAMQRASGDRARQLAWFASGLVLAAACVVTHHLSSYIAVVVSVCIAVVTVARVVLTLGMARPWRSP